jgi:hypothetical protein
MGLDRGSAVLGPNDDAFCAKVVRVKGPEGMTVEEGSRTAIFLTVEGSDGGKTRKTPLNAGENDMEPVVGIGRFNSMNRRKISGISRNSRSYGKPPEPSVSCFS